MEEAKLTSDGQVTIPSKVRAALDLKVGDRVAFVEVAPGHFELLALNMPVSALKGMLRSPGRAITIEQMNAAIAGERN